MKVPYLLIAGIGLVTCLGHTAMSQVLPTGPANTTQPPVLTNAAQTTIQRLEAQLSKLEAQKKSESDLLKVNEVILKDMATGKSPNVPDVVFDLGTENQRLKKSIEEIEIRIVVTKIQLVEKKHQAPAAPPIANKPIITQAECIEAQRALDAQAENLRQNTVTNATIACDIMNNNIAAFHISRNDCRPTVVKAGPNGELNCVQPIGDKYAWVVNGRTKPVQVLKEQLARMKFERGTYIYSCKLATGKKHNGKFTLDNIYY